jgi:FtsP/CotA-like multicopper oxidase with cupredoxin domain
LRFDVPLGGPQADWVTPANFKVSAAPAFRAKAGRAVVLALTNRAELAEVFHLHGHHFRVLDRLDDGWKPFWLATVLVDAGQTARIAFLADNPGKWLIECVGIDYPEWVAGGWFEVA